MAVLGVKTGLGGWDGWHYGALRKGFRGDLAVSARGCGQIAQCCAVIELLHEVAKGLRAALDKATNVHESTRIVPNSKLIQRHAERTVMWGHGGRHCETGGVWRLRGGKCSGSEFQDFCVSLVLICGSPRIKNLPAFFRGVRRL